MSPSRSRAVWSPRVRPWCPRACRVPARCTPGAPAGHRPAAHVPPPARVPAAALPLRGRAGDRPGSAGARATLPRHARARLPADPAGLPPALVPAGWLLARLTTCQAGVSQAPGAGGRAGSADDPAGVRRAVARPPVPPPVPPPVQPRPVRILRRPHRPRPGPTAPVRPRRPRPGAWTAPAPRAARAVTPSRSSPAQTTTPPAPSLPAPAVAVRARRDPAAARWKAAGSPGAVDVAGPRRPRLWLRRSRPCRPPRPAAAGA
jgi:translation initiation factor IF-2